MGDLVNQQCPNCGPVSATTSDSRPSKILGIQSTRRRRECPNCKARFTTYEIPESLIKDAFHEAKKQMITNLVNSL
ncbi:hypothetical protein K3X44_09910 [Aliiroseovarius crassostreae]|uniref:NrdR family transcriptional regulator n=1 Tax=Aliiroseovarius crassostreae TaxID=154981 RepID=UPI00220C924D|nr:hypothetical protein [Aliiroseovarius crassostreae]UWQ00830.1 hypothetical protein K3X44_09910 [Aliiroseovarius crassostreae]